MADWQKYGYFDYLEITNDDVVPVSVVLDSRDAFYCAAGGIKTINDKAFRFLRIINKSATTASIVDKIVLSLRRNPVTVDTVARNLPWVGGFK